MVSCDSSGSRESPFPRKVAGFADLTNHSAFRVTAGRIFAREKRLAPRVQNNRKAVRNDQFTSRGLRSRRDTMPVGTGKKREKVPFQQVLLQLSPFYWQGDASWGWNTKVPLWTGEREFAILPFRTRKIDDVSRRPKTRRGAPADSFLASFDPYLNQNVSTDDFSSVRSQVPARWRLSASSSSITSPPFSA